MINANRTRLALGSFSAQPMHTQTKLALALPLVTPWLIIAAGLIIACAGSLLVSVLA